jgi:hypothetical protein
MPATVYAWPPVGAVGREWDHVAPISESFSILTGKRYVSAAKPERRVAQVVVSAKSCDKSGAGYMLMLKRLLQGGQHLIRLRSQLIQRRINTADYEASRGSVPLGWDDGAADLLWTMPPTELLWYEGTLIDGTTTTSRGFPAISCTGFPPLTVVARPGEYLTVYEDEDDTVGSTAQVLAPAASNILGQATIRLYSALAYGGRVRVGTRPSAVFRAIGELPRTLIPDFGDWTYGWQFEEVFSDDVGGFTEETDWYVATGPAL